MKNRVFLHRLALVLWFGVAACDAGRPPVRSEPVRPPDRSEPVRPAGAGGLCDALSRRSVRCPSERRAHGSGACRHDDLCLKALLRPAALEAFLGCVGELACGPELEVELTCMDQVVRSTPPVEEQARALAACAERGPRCGGKVAANCRAVPLLRVSVLKRVSSCLELLTCDQVGRCIETALEIWGCP